MSHAELVLFFVLLQLAIIVLAGRVGGVVALRWGQAAAVGEIIVGILLGPSFLGLVTPHLFHFIFHSVSSEPLTILSQIGLIFLMFQIGLEFDFVHLSVRHNQRAVLLIAGASLLVPFVFGVTFGWETAFHLSPHAVPMASALFIGTAFAITALPILGRILIDFKMTRTRLGVIVISAAAINDVVGWLLLALVTTLAHGPVHIGSFIGRVTLVLLFGVTMVVVVRPGLSRLIRFLQRPDDALPPTLLGLLLALMFLSGMTTSLLGIFAIFGGFIMGVIVHSEAALVRAWRAQISPFVLVFFLPIFFTYTGLRTDIDGLNTVSLWGWCLAFVALAMLSKYGGAYIAARFSGLSVNESRVVGILMNTRALMELIVINVGYDLHAISHIVFTMLVIMSVVSTVITTPYLRYWWPRVLALQNKK